MSLSLPPVGNRPSISSSDRYYHNPSELDDDLSDSEVNSQDDTERAALSTLVEDDEEADPVKEVSPPPPQQQAPTIDSTRFQAPLPSSSISRSIAKLFSDFLATRPSASPLTPQLLARSVSSSPPSNPTPAHSPSPVLSADPLLSTPNLLTGLIDQFCRDKHIAPAILETDCATQIDCAQYVYGCLGRPYTEILIASPRGNAVFEAIKTRLRSLNWIYIGIQKELKGGRDVNATYRQMKRQLIESYCGLTALPSNFEAALQKNSYESLPFLQIAFSYLDQTLLACWEKKRQDAFNELNNYFKTGKVEHKFSLLRFFYSGALILPQMAEPLYYRDLLLLWAQSCSDLTDLAGFQGMLSFALNLNSLTRQRSFSTPSQQPSPADVHSATSTSALTTPQLSTRSLQSGTHTSSLTTPQLSTRSLQSGTNTPAVTSPILVSAVSQPNVNHPNLGDVYNKLAGLINTKFNTSELRILLMGMSFHDFLIECTLVTLEDHFKICLSEAVAIFFKDRLKTKEAVRLDICFFLLQLDALDTLLKVRDSGDILYSLRIFDRLVNFYHLNDPAQKTSLMELLIYRPPRTPLPSGDQDLAKEIKSAWLAVNLFSKRVKNVLQDPGTYPLFYFFLRRDVGIPLQQSFLRFFENMMDRMALTPTAAGKFCEANKEITISALCQFEEICNRIFDDFDIKPYIEVFFSEPPICVTGLPKGDILIGRLKQFARWYEQHYGRHNSESASPQPSISEHSDQERILLLRKYLERDLTPLFCLFDEAWGYIAPSEPFLSVANLLQIITEMNPTFIPKTPLTKDEKVQSAASLVSSLKKYRFSNEKLYPLFFTFLDQLRRQIDLSKITALLEHLEQFSPLFSTNDYFTLCRFYTPEEHSIQILSLLEALRTQFISKREYLLEQMFLPRDVLDPITKEIGRVTSRLASRLPIAQQEAFRTSFSNSLRLSFLPPPEPLIASFERLREVIEKSGRPQDLRIEPMHHRFSDRISILLGWHIRQNDLLLILSAGDSKNASSCAQSQVSLDLPPPETIGIGFLLTVLHELATNLFQEQIPPGKVLVNSNDPSVWVNYFDPLMKDAITNLNSFKKIKGVQKNYKEKTWDFLKKVKTMYRRVYLKGLIGEVGPLQGPKAPQLNQSKLAVDGDLLDL